MQRSILRHRRQSFEELGIDALDQVIALLIDLVDVPLHLSDSSVGSVGAACLIFFVPEVEVGTVLLADQFFQRVMPRLLRDSRFVPLPYPL